MLRLKICKEISQVVPEFLEMMKVSNQLNIIGDPKRCP